MTRAADALVLGGGPAGAAAAAALAAGGMRVMVVERAAGPREVVCGEFLGADAARALARLGLDVAALGGVPIGRAVLAGPRREAGFALPFPAWGLSRAVLDPVLLAAAAAAGAAVLRGRVAREAVPDGPGWAARLDDGSVLRARHLVLATGKHELRGLARATARPRAVGLKLHLRPAAPVTAVALLPCAGGYAGLQPGPGGAANLCAALDPALAGAAGRDAAALLGHVAAGSRAGARLLAGAVPLWPRPLAVAGVPYGFLHRDPPGAAPLPYRVGDQFAVIPSLCGDGVAMALAGGLAAAAAILAGVPAADFHAARRRRAALPLRLAGAAGAVLRAAPGAAALGLALVPGAGAWVARRTRAA